MEPLDWERLARQVMRGAAPTAAAPAKTIAVRAQEAAARWADAPAFVEGERSVSFAAIFEQARRLAAGLRRLGLRPGEVISFQLPNWIEAATVNLATSLGGWICNPIVPIYRDAEMTGMLGDCRSRALFVPGTWRGVDYAAMARRVAQKVPSLQHVITVRAEQGPLRYEELLQEAPEPPAAWPQVDPHAIKMVMYTSGTTGPAKGVLHSHASLPVAVERAFVQWRLGRGEAVLMPSPVTHATGYCFGLELPFATGVSTVLMERWNAVEAAALIRRHRVTATIGATPFLQELLDAVPAEQPLPLAVFACGGAAVPAELIRRAGSRLTGFACRAYGATEAPLVTFGRSRDDDEAIGATTDGRLNGYEVRVVDQAGRSLGLGQEGEILVRGDGLFLGYTNPAATAEAFAPDGWFRTGDLGIVDARGTLTITGRKKDLIIRGGENISAKEIEDVLHTHPAVVEACVVSAPHPRMGEAIAAFLRTRDGGCPSVAELAGFVTAAGLARQKCPEHVRVLEDYPRTASGKIRKDVLRRLIREDLAGPGAAAGS